MIRIDGLLKKIMRAVLHRLYGFVNRAISCHHDHRCGTVCGFCGPQYIEARSVRHAQIRQNNLVRHPGYLGAGYARVSGLSNRITGVFRRQTQNAAQTLFVFDEKDVWHDERQRSNGP